MYLDKERRIIYYSCDISEEFAAWFMYSFMELDRTEGTISIVCSSLGGTYDTACIPVMDMILWSKNHVVCYGSGAQASSQAFIFLAADERYLTSERSYILLHAGTAGNEEEMDLRDFKKAAEIVEFQMNQDMQYFSERSDKPPSYFRLGIEAGDFYLYPQKAMEIGLIHGIANINGQ